MPGPALSPDQPELQYRRTSLMIVLGCVLLATLITLSTAGLWEVGAVDRQLLGLLVLKNAVFLLWLWRAPGHFLAVGLLELGVQVAGTLVRMTEVLLHDFTLHGLGGYSYWTVMTYLVASLVLAPRLALGVSLTQLGALAALAAAFWTNPAIPAALRLGNGNALLQMLLMHVTFLAIVTLQQRLRQQYARALLQAERQAERQASLALRDDLTGLPNRRQLEQWLATAQAPASVAYFDLDHFKRVNDTYGHDVGDDVLRAVARQARACIRSGDRLGRWGGEEFLILVQGDTRSAQMVTERLRQSLRAHPHPQAGVVTISCGVAQGQPGEPPDATLRRADEALYAAKRAGRDTVTVAA